MRFCQDFKTAHPLHGSSVFSTDEQPQTSFSGRRIMSNQTFQSQINFTEVESIQHNHSSIGSKKNGLLEASIPKVEEIKIPNLAPKPTRIPQFPHSTKVDHSIRLGKLDDIMERIKKAQYEGQTQIQNLNEQVQILLKQVEANASNKKIIAKKDIFLPKKQDLKVRREVVAECTPEQMRAKRQALKNSKSASTAILPKIKTEATLKAIPVSAPPKILKPIPNQTENFQSEKGKMHKKRQVAENNQISNNVHRSIVENNRGGKESRRAENPSKLSSVESSKSPFTNTSTVKNHSSEELACSPISRSNNNTYESRSPTIQKKEYTQSKYESHPSTESNSETVVKVSASFSQYSPLTNKHASYESSNSPFHTARKTILPPVVDKSSYSKDDVIKIQDSIAQFQKYLKAEAQRSDLY